MNLSSDLITQLVKVTGKTAKPTKTETTVYGTIREYDGAKYVQLDGSDLLTPVSTTTDMLDGERVTVMIKNHAATVTGNITSPAARTDDVLTLGDGVSQVIIKVDESSAAITNAAKTATNFMSLDDQNGLQIGDKSSGDWHGFRTQILSNAFNILNVTGEVVASYGHKLIELGKNAADAVIKLCGGKGTIEYVTDEDSSTSYFQIVSERLRLKSSKMSSLYSVYTDNSTRYEKSAVNVTPTKVEVYASECIDPALVDKIESWNTSGIDVNSDGVKVTTPGTFEISAASIKDGNGDILSVTKGTSGMWSYKKWSNGDVEVWGAYEVSNMECNAELGSMYRTDYFNPSDFPFTIHNANLVASYESDGYGAMLWATSTTTSTKPPSYYLIRPTSATIVSGKIIFRVTGRVTN